MSEHIELLVPVKANTGLNLCKILLWVLTVILALAGLVGVFGLIPIIVAIATGVGAYFVGLRVDTEYEYTLTDRELDVDIIYSKEKRKHITTFDLNKLELMARLGSYRLDGQEHRGLKTEDYSSKEESRKKDVFVMIYEGSRRILIEPDEKLFKAIYSVAPSKVFKD